MEQTHTFQPFFLTETRTNGLNPSIHIGNEDTLGKAAGGGYDVQSTALTNALLSHPVTKPLLQQAILKAYENGHLVRYTDNPRECARGKTAPYYGVSYAKDEANDGPACYYIDGTVGLHNVMEFFALAGFIAIKQYSHKGTCSGWLIMPYSTPYWKWLADQKGLVT
jgi:hypothetical protein